ncbi:hypothetical protein [Arthrobacter sp. NPDC056727]|uniref:hypothetical protein n=1 Tax=Arthrobacter sp. NPDC056727 TaxID=3345927 RepID=UPI00366BDFF3
MPLPPRSLLQFQLECVIDELLALPDLDPDARDSLLDHLAVNPGRPDLALLAHIRDVQDPAELPPYKNGPTPRN